MQYGSLPTFRLSVQAITTSYFIEKSGMYLILQGEIRVADQSFQR
jgi:hypothetical protein